MASEKKQVINGFAWKFMEKVSGQMVSFILQIVLARLLLPSQFGLIAMINVFITLANVFVVSGFSSSLIQKKDADRLDFSSIFWCSFTVSFFMYAAIYISAPLIEKFYDMPGLSSVTRVYALSLLFNSYLSNQQAYVSRHMMFKKLFYSTLVGTIVSGILGVILAYIGFGVWALVTQGLVSIIANIIVLQFVVAWYPRFEFSFSRASRLVVYGANILGASLIGKIFEELRQLLIGKYYTSADLAFYNRGNSFPRLFSSNIESSIEQVLFPAMSNHSDKPETIKAMMRRSIRISSYVMFFFMTLLALSSKPLIALLLTEKWLEAVPYMQAVCLAHMISIMSTANMQAIKATGRSDILLKLEFYKKPIFLVILILAVRHSVMAVAMTMPLYSVFAALINMYPNKRLLGYSIIEQLKDLVPSILLSLLMAICIYPFLYLPTDNELLIMLVQVTIGAGVYLFASKLFKVEQFEYIVDTVHSYKTNK